MAFVASVLWPRWSALVTPDAPNLPITIGGVTFNIPPAAIRVAVQRRPGAQDRVDLSFAWPDLTVPELDFKRPPPDKLVPDRLFVTIETSGGGLTPADRLKSIYPRYAAAEPFSGPDGLHGAKFRDGTPYQGEDLFVDTTNPEHFTARCTRPGRGETQGTCLLERRIGGAALTMRFPRDWLVNWRDVTAGADRLISALRPSGP